MFGRIETLVSFSSVWYVGIVVGYRMMVWQGNCQVRCIWQKSCGVVVKGFVAKKISSVGFVLQREEGSGRALFSLELCLEEKYKTIHCVMYSRRQSVYLRVGFDG